MSESFTNGLTMTFSHQLITHLFLEQINKPFIELTVEQIRMFRNLKSPIDGEPYLVEGKAPRYGQCATNLTLKGKPVFELVSLKKAVDFIQEKKEDGADCPCCKRFFKEYKRNYTSAMAFFLLALYKKSYYGGEDREYYYYVNIFDFAGIKFIPDYSKNEYWGLIERMPVSEQELKESGKKSSGYFRITGRGKDFVQGNVKIEKIAHVLFDVINGFSGGEISFKDSFSTKFNFQELIER